MKCSTVPYVNSDRICSSYLFIFSKLLNQVIILHNHLFSLLNRSCLTANGFDKIIRDLSAKIDRKRSQISRINIWISSEERSSQIFISVVNHETVGGNLFFDLKRFLVISRRPRCRRSGGQIQSQAWISSVFQDEWSHQVNISAVSRYISYRWVLPRQNHRHQMVDVASWIPISTRWTFQSVRIGITPQSPPTGNGSTSILDLLRWALLSVIFVNIPRYSARRDQYSWDRPDDLWIIKAQIDNHTSHQSVPTARFGITSI